MPKRRAISRIPIPSFLSCRSCFSCSIAIGFCAMLLDFRGAKDCKKPLLPIAYGLVNMPEWQSLNHLRGNFFRWVNIPESDLPTWQTRPGRGVGQHPRMVVNMEQNLQYVNRYKNGLRQGIIWICIQYIDNQYINKAPQYGVFGNSTTFIIFVRSF